MTEREKVPPSSEPTSATATGTGDASSGTTATPDDAASTTGLGPHEEQQARGGPPPAESPLDVSGTGTHGAGEPGEQGRQSPSGT